MTRSDSVRKAEQLLRLHHEPQLLVLPNVWDALGARILQELGFPAVATASAAIAFSKGYDDGERLRFDTMLSAVAHIAGSVDVPVTADIEAGYADEPAAVAANIRRLLAGGIVGINFEDSLPSGRLRPISQQVDRLRAVRDASDDMGIPLVLNARVDTYCSDSVAAADRFAETRERAAAYVEAGADCIYPLGLEDLDLLAQLRSAVDVPLNVYAGDDTPSPRTLEAAGISRLSLGPGMLRATTTTFLDWAKALLPGGDYGETPRPALTSDEIRPFLRDGNEACEDTE